VRASLARLLNAVFSSRGLLISMLLAGAAAGTAFLGLGGSTHEVVALFSDANGLVVGNEVRVAGVEAGTVKTVEIVVDLAKGQQYARTVLEINGDHWPLHQGAKFAVRPKGVLSNVYVTLDPGSKTAPELDSGHVFGLDETSSPINLDELGNIFDRNVRESIRTQLQEGIIAFGGAGADNTNATIQNLNPLTAGLAPLTAVLAERSPELDRLNSEFDTITAELASEDANLRGLVTNGNTVLGVLADNASHLQATLVHAAGTLQSIDNGLRGEEQNLKAIFAKGPASLDKLRRSNELLIPVIDYVNPYIPHLDHVLWEFVSATGLQAQCNALNGGSGCEDAGKDKGNIFTIRVDATLPGPGRTGVPCGGEPAEQGNLGAGCKDRPNTGGGSGGGSSSGAGSSGASSASSATLDLGTLFGGLFG